MNGISEFDCELLEAYLDDALSPTQVQHVSLRLLAEPELAAAMHELRAHRVLRMAAWRSVEPTDVDAAAVARHVATYARRDARRRAIREIVRIGSAVAAAITVFLAGWFLRSSASPGVLAQETRGPAGATSRTAPIRAGPASASGFQIAILDESGNVIAVQKFAKLEEARQFAGDVLRYEARRREVQDGDAVLISDHF